MALFLLWLLTIMVFITLRLYRTPHLSQYHKKFFSFGKTYRRRVTKFCMFELRDDDKYYDEYVY